MFRYSRLIVAGVVVAFASWCVLSLRADISRMSLWPLWESRNLALAVVMLTFLSYTLRIARWRWYLTRLGYRVPLGFAAMTYVAGFAFTLSPGKLGELLRARYYTAAGVPLRDVTAAFCVERLMDLLALLILALLAIRAFPHYQGSIWSAGVVIAIAAAVPAFLPTKSITHLLESSPRLPRRLAQAAGSALRSLDAARSLMSPQTLILGLLVALAAWGLEGFGLGLLGSIFSPTHNDVSISAGIYAVAVLLGALSFLPGGLGSTETVMAALLTSRGYTFADALMATLACRATTLWLGVGLGWIAIALLRHGPQQETNSLMRCHKWPSEP
jgi:uncharacterized protein (TIRG00374 family)